MDPRKPTYYQVFTRLNHPLDEKDQRLKIILKGMI